MPGKFTVPRGTPKPKCLTCGVSVKAHRNRFCSFRCVPLAVRQEAGRKSAEARRFKFRRQRFEAQFADLTRHGQKLTKEDILDAFMAVYRLAYNRGLNCGLNRVRAAQKQAA